MNKISIKFCVNRVTGFSSGFTAGYAVETHSRGEIKKNLKKNDYHLWGHKNDVSSERKNFSNYGETTVSEQYKKFIDSSNNFSKIVDVMRGNESGHFHFIDKSSIIISSSENQRFSQAEPAEIWEILMWWEKMKVGTFFHKKVPTFISLTKVQ